MNKRIGTKNKRGGQGGFTLLELMLYITLVAGILITATSFAWTIINSRTKAFAVQEVEQNARLILETITQSAHAAQDITQPAAGAAGATLALTMRDPLSSPTTFTPAGTALTVSAGAGPAVALHSANVQVTSLQFSNLSDAAGTSKNVTVRVTLSHRNPDNRAEWHYERTYTTTIELRDR